MLPFNHARQAQVLRSLKYRVRKRRDFMIWNFYLILALKAHKIVNRRFGDQNGLLKKANDDP